MIEARHTVLAHRGQLMEPALNRERIASQDVFSAMHKAGITELWDVEWAILEADGEIAIVPRRAST